MFSEEVPTMQIIRVSLNLDRVDFDGIKEAINMRAGDIVADGEGDWPGRLLAAVCREWVEANAASFRSDGSQLTETSE